MLGYDNTLNTTIVFMYCRCTCTCKNNQYNNLPNCEPYETNRILHGQTLLMTSAEFGS